MQRHATDLPQTLVVRKDKQSGAISVTHSQQRLPSRPRTAAEIAELQFTPVDNAIDNSTDPTSWGRWRFHWNYNFGYYPYYRYYGYNYYYTPYYNYYSYPYYYYYYSWPYHW